MPKRNRFRAEFRKNRSGKPPRADWTRKVAADDGAHESLPSGERVSGKGDRSRKRTVVGAVADQDSGMTVLLDIDPAVCRFGRVLSVHGLASTVQAEDQTLFRCATRRLLKTLSTDLRHVVVAGDWVWFRPAGNREGIIERVEARKGVLSRATRGRRQMLVANVDQLLIVGSAAEPTLKPNLIDRFLVSAHQSQVRPIIVINKMDLVDPADYQPLVGVYRQMGYEVLLVSATKGWGMEQLKQTLAGAATAVCGQSGVGKSSLLNAIDSNLQLRTATVSTENEKGRHTTTTARLLPIASGGYVVDTPGIRQFQLWDVIAAEVAGYFRDIRPYTNYCRFPNCTHTHEADCAVKNAAADGRLDMRRYESFCALVAGEAA